MCSSFCSRLLTSFVDLARRRHGNYVDETIQKKTLSPKLKAVFPEIR